MEQKKNRRVSAVFQEADVSSKRIFGNHTLCAQFLRDYSGLELFANVQPEDIEDVSERYHLFREVELNSDTVKKVRIRNRAEGEHQDIYVISLIEHKSAVDHDVTMQILRYMVCIWENYVRELEEAAGAEIGREDAKRKKRKDFKYPPIYPIVYYEGADEWTVAWNLRERILLGELFQPYIPDITYKLVRTREYSNEELLSKEDEIFQRAPADIVDIMLSELQSFCVRVNLSNQETTELIEKVKDGNMGYLFENMEKMDIQLERRRTEEQKQKAEEQEKRADEACQMLLSAYQMLISSYKMQGMKREDVRKQLITGLSLEEKEIDQLIEKFWGK